MPQPLLLEADALPGEPDEPHPLFLVSKPGCAHPLTHKMPLLPPQHDMLPSAGQPGVAPD